MTALLDTPAGIFQVATELFADIPAYRPTPGDAIDLNPGRRTWTVAWRKKTGPVFHRATNFAGTWAQAFYLAQALGEAQPELQIWYTITADHEALEAELVASGEMHDYGRSEDWGKILTDADKRVKIRDNGILSDAVLARALTPEQAQAKFNQKAEK